MRKLFFLFFAVCVSASAFSQSTVKKKINRAGDHFMLQLATNFWSGSPDSVKDYVKTFNRSANVYLMLDKPFKGNPKFSVGLGIGVGTSNIYFDKMEVKIDRLSSTVPFIRTDTGYHYKKYKVSTAYLEAPIELRFTAKPETPNKSMKAAIGIKVGTLLGAHTKGKTLETSTGTKLNGFTSKVSSKSFFNSTKIALTARVGYGMFTLFGSYGITNVFKSGTAADIRVVQAGITISGL